MLNWKNIAIAILPGLLLYSPTTWAEQWFLPEPLTWDYNLDYDGRWTNEENNVGIKNKSQTDRWTNQLTFKKRFHLLDPQISSFSLVAKPFFIQESEYSSSNDQTKKSDSKAWDYTASTNLLHGARVPFSLSASSGRSSGTTDGDFGSETDFTNEQDNLNINLKTTWFPSHFFYSKNHKDLLITSLSGDRQEKYEVERKGFVGRSSKMSLSLEAMDYLNIIYPNRDYTTERGWINHQVTWGKGSYLRSYGDTVEQTGFGANSRHTINESLHLQHTTNFASDARYHYNKTKTASTITINQGELDFSYKLYSNLDAQVGYQTKLTEFDLGEETSEGPRYSINYTKGLPWPKSSLSFGISGSELEFDRQAQSQLVNTIEEYTVASTIFTLNNPFVSVVTDVSFKGGGPVPLAAYNVVTVANYTEIQILNIVTVPIGTTLVITYDYLTPPEMRYTTNHRGSNFILQLWDFRAHYNYSVGEQELLTDARRDFLNDHTEKSGGINYQLALRRFQVAIGYLYRKSETGNYESETNTWNQSLNFRITPLIYLTESLNSGKTETLASDSSNLSSKIGANFFIPQLGIKIGSHLNHWQRDDNLGNDDRFLSHGATVNWRYHLIRIQAGLSFNDWSGTSRNSEETRFMLTFTRSSR